MAPDSSSQSQSVTQIPVPTSLTSSNTSLPPLTSHLLISHLRQTNAIADLSTLLTDSLARTGWTDRVRALALELLRNGSCDTFPELLEEVLRRCKLPADSNKGDDTSGGGGGSSSTAKGSDRKSRGGGGKTVPNGTQAKDQGGSSTAPTSAPGSQAQAGGAGAGVNGAGSIMVREGWFGADGLPDVRVPGKTVDIAVEFLKEKIVECVEGVDDDD